MSWSRKLTAQPDEIQQSQIRQCRPRVNVNQDIHEPNHPMCTSLHFRYNCIINLSSPVSTPALHSAKLIT